MESRDLSTEHHSSRNTLLQRVQRDIQRIVFDLACRVAQALQATAPYAAGTASLATPVVATVSVILPANTAEAISPNSDIAMQRVSLIELNHLYDERGQHLLDQLIFYDWSTESGRFDVIAWRKVKSNAQIPQRNYATNRYSVSWYDRGILRHVCSCAYEETWIQYDPEVLHRKQLPVEQRVELRNPQRPVIDFAPQPGNQQREQNGRVAPAPMDMGM